MFGIVLGTGFGSVFMLIYIDLGVIWGAYRGAKSVKKRCRSRLKLGCDFGWLWEPKEGWARHGWCSVVF